MTEQVAYPLSWPLTWPRTKQPQRSRFGTYAKKPTVIESDDPSAALAQSGLDRVNVPPVR